MFIIEFYDDSWIRHSYHQNQEWAEISGEVIFKSRGCQVRLVKNGAIIMRWGDI